MEADQADSPGDSSPDPELSRFIENMGLRFESCPTSHRRPRAGNALSPLHAVTFPVRRIAAPDHLREDVILRSKVAAGLAYLPGGMPLPTGVVQRITARSGYPTQPLIRQARRHLSLAEPDPLRSRVRITV